MNKTEALGWLARLIVGFQNLFGNYQGRVKDSLISTSDALIYWLGNPEKANGDPYSVEYTGKKVRHYIRQYKANRKKLK